MKRHFRALLATMLAGFICTPGIAQERYPARAVRVVVPFAAGGATDVLTRVAASELSKRLGQNFVVENITGAGGLIGAQQVVAAKPDGYTLLAGSPGPITIMPVIARKPVGYDVDRDLTPITLIADSPGAMVVGKGSKYRSVQEVLSAGKAGARITCGSSGVGAFSHLNCELFKSLTGLDIVHVPYRGAAPALVDLVGGQFDFIIENYPSPAKLIESGEVRLLGVTSATRFGLKPDAATLVESGVAGHVMSAWIGLMAPTGTPSAVVDLIQRETAEGLKDESIRKRLADMGVVGGGNTPADFARYLTAERDTYRTLSARTGLKVD